MSAKYFSLLVSSVAVAALFTGCGSTQDADVAEAADSAGTVVTASDTKAQNVFYSIPSPIETTTLLKNAGAKYNAAYLNPIENVSRYNSVASKALNLGVYGSDLSFTSIFDQTQESMLYLRCANKLSTGLGISGAFDENTTARLESNMENRDSLLSIISESYWTADSYLKENGQPGVSALIVAGGWIEGLYIATKIAADTKNKEITTRIGEQKLSLNNLIELLDSQKGSNPAIGDLQTRLKGLQEIYAGVESQSGETKSTTDSTAGITTIENGASFALSDEQLSSITAKTAEIRAQIIQ